MNSKMTNEFNQFTEVSYNTNRNERPVYRNFAASKMSSSVKPQSLVEFKDFMGRTHKVAVRNNTELKNQMKFFAILKKESFAINEIICSFPLSFGKVPKKFLNECKKDLRSIGLNKRAIDIVLG